MNDRPRTGGPDDGSEGQEFGWLYGGGGQQPPSAPEPTRVIPVQQRPGSPTPPRPPQPSPTPTGTLRVPAPAPTPPPYGAPADPPPGGGGGRRGRRGGGAAGVVRAGFWARRLVNPFWYVRMVLLLVLLFVVYTVAVPFFTWKSADQVAFEPKGDRPGDQPGTTYLMVGSDSRKGLTKAQREELSTGNPQSELTDTILLLHTGDGPSVLLSVPRDSIVDMPGYGPSKINSAYSRGGPQLLVRTLENETGIRIDQYVEIGLGGLADVVDAVGGIEVCPRERLKDPLAGLDIKKGCQEVDGATALAYSRSRKQSTFGDLERVRRQREVIGAVGDKVLSPWSVLNPFRWWDLNHAVPSFFGFGEGMGVTDAGRWALAMTSTGKGDNRTCTMPVTDLSANTWDRDRADPMFQAIISDKTDAITDEQCTENGIVR